MEIENRYNAMRREIAQWLIVVGATLFGSVYLTLVVYYIFISEDKWIIDVAKAHFAAAIGLPLAAVAALFVVSIFEITTGKIEFEGLGFKFHGASGPVILWVICFLTIFDFDSLKIPHLRGK
jgi:hypothetical protein